MKRPHILKETRYLPRKVKGKSGNLAKNKNNGTLPIRNERGNSLLVERKVSKLEYTKNKKKTKETLLTRIERRNSLLWSERFQNIDFSEDEANEKLLSCIEKGRITCLNLGEAKGIREFRILAMDCHVSLTY